MSTDITAQALQAAALASALGPEWAALDAAKDKRDPGQHWYDWYLKRVGGMELNLNWRDGRLRVDPRWPHQKNHGAQCKPYEAPDLGITLDPTRAPALLARDVYRRLVTPYEDWYRQACDLRDARDRRDDRTAQNIDRLVRNYGAHRPTNGAGGIYLGSDSYGYRLDVSNDSVRFEHFSVPMAVAEKVLEALRKPAQTDAD